MFEKDAEEYADKKCGKENRKTTGWVLTQDDFQKGAEFGYNKANEWHYVKDGDLPKHENYVLVSNGKDWTKGFYKDKKWNIISLVGFIRIIAWKEIVLPKENDIKSEMFPEITLPEGSAEFVDKVITDAEKRLKENE